MVLVVDLVVGGLLRYAPGAEPVILWAQFLRGLRIPNALAYLLANELADEVVRFLVEQDVAEVAEPHRKAGVPVEFLPERSRSSSETSNVERASDSWRKPPKDPRHFAKISG